MFKKMENNLKNKDISPQLKLIEYLKKENIRDFLEKNAIKYVDDKEMRDIINYLKETNIYKFLSKINIFVELINSEEDMNQKMKDINNFLYSKEIQENNCYCKYDTMIVLIISSINLFIKNGHEYLINDYLNVPVEMFVYIKSSKLYKDDELSDKFYKIISIDGCSLIMDCYYDFIFCKFYKNIVNNEKFDLTDMNGFDEFMKIECI